jgi:ureidoglycolate hydrolase
MDIQAAPDGLTTKYARLANIVNNYPADTGAVTGISVFRATPKVGLERGKVFDIRYMERHPYTSQAFVPMGKGEVSGCESPVSIVLIQSGQGRARNRSKKAERCWSLSPRMDQTIDRIQER